MRAATDRLYRFPWSRTDNPGGWVEVTDACDMSCAACYRHRLEGHRPLAEIQEEILLHRQERNCDRIAIAGGEPLLYPDIVSVVEFIARQGMKPMILTNGVRLTRDLAETLRKAGLVQFYFHIDSGQRREGWTGKSESDLNALRQYYADLCWDTGVQCGYNTTIYPATLKAIPDIVAWCRRNVQKVQHLSLIAFRALPLGPGRTYLVGGRPADLSGFHATSTNADDMAITTDQMLGILQASFPDLHPAAYLNGTSAQQTRKFMVMVTLGSQRGVFGSVGGITLELDQIFHHLRYGRYSASMENPRIGKKVFFLSPIDRRIRNAFGHWLLAWLRHPHMFLESVFTQAINLQQPNEIVDGLQNLCEGCVNMMAYKGKWIHSCQLDEYRILGGPIEGVVNGEKSESLLKDPVALA